MKKVFTVLFSVCTVLFFISCGSKPAPEEPKPQPPVAEEKEEPIDTEPEQTENNEEDLTALTAKIEEARNLAVQEGAEQKIPDLLNAVDSFYEKSKGDNLADNADSIIDRYDLLVKYIKAKEAKIEIDENNLASYAQKNYDAGTEDLQKVEDAVKSSENISGAVKNSADNAISNFNTVITAAYKRMAKDQRSLAYEAKVNADSVKAGVSQKERYKIAADDFKNGDSLYSMQNPKKALEKYVSATQKFSELYKEVSEKRAAAQAAVDAAKKKVLESSEYAADADRDAPISEKIDGIEDENAVLLEEDNYENPADAEAEIAENIEDEDFEDEYDFENKNQDESIIENDEESEGDNKTVSNNISENETEAENISAENQTEINKEENAQNADDDELKNPDENNSEINAAESTKMIDEEILNEIVIDDTPDEEYIAEETVQEKTEVE